jgi:hypothetical protein
MKPFPRITILHLIRHIQKHHLPYHNWISVLHQTLNVHIYALYDMNECVCLVVFFPWLVQY